MSPTSTNRSPRHRPTDVGDSDFEGVNTTDSQKAYRSKKTLSWEVLYRKLARYSLVP
ncbi:MAG: hypothetical protein K2H92_08930 [Bacteroidaceae bacterium]|nr:hypothetical protein [Bacteroidaceae bacterium]